jgi:hypothetical protein
MINPDFSDRTYTAEVSKCKTGADAAFDRIAKLVTDPNVAVEANDSDQASIKVCHGFVATKQAFDRYPRSITTKEGVEITIPRQRKIRGKECYLYDVIVAQSQSHVIVAVPFHELAEDFFLRVDELLGGTGSSYQKLDITAMVIKLGAAGVTNALSKDESTKIELSINRCHLSFVDQTERTSNLQKITMTGTNLGLAKEYKSLINPVLNPKSSSLTVTPFVLGFTLSENGVRKSSATTDRHGNFKIWIAAGLRRLTRLFKLLSTLEQMKDVALTTTNIPILQSSTIRDAEA